MTTTLVKNVTVVRPDGSPEGDRLDITFADGRFVRVEPDLPAEDADTVQPGRETSPGIDNGT